MFVFYKIIYKRPPQNQTQTNIQTATATSTPVTILDTETVTSAIPASPEISSELERQTKDIVALTQSENIKEIAPKRLARLQFITDHKPETASYLLRHLTNKDTVEYKDLLNDYFLSDMSVGGVSAIAENPGEAITSLASLTKVAEQTGTSTVSAIDLTTAFEALTFDVNFIDDSTALVIFYDCSEGCEAYNFESRIYTYYFDKVAGTIRRNAPPALSIDKATGTVAQINDTKFTIDGLNTGYDATRDMMVASTFKSYPLYPCTRYNFYEIHYDRLLLKHSEILASCVNKNGEVYSDEDILSKPEISTADDTEIKSLYDAPEADYKKMLDYQLLSNNPGT